MRLRRHIELAILLAAIGAVTPAAGQTYKWVDESGVTHYSDRKPDDPKEAKRLKPVSGMVSVYSPDKSLLDAVEAARKRRAQPDYRSEPDREPVRYAVPAVAQVPAYPCDQPDCDSYYYPYAPAGYFPMKRRRAVHLVQAQFPPGAIAGTVTGGGIIPGTSGTAVRLFPIAPGATPRRMTTGVPSPLDSQFSRR